MRMQLISTCDKKHSEVQLIVFNIYNDSNHNSFSFMKIKARLLILFRLMRKSDRIFTQETVLSNLTGCQYEYMYK